LLHVAVKARQPSQGAEPSPAKPEVKHATRTSVIDIVLASGKSPLRRDLFRKRLGHDLSVLYA
jgi:hypothetical protein